MSQGSRQPSAGPSTRRRVKSRATVRKNKAKLPVGVIELTDSDSEDEMIINPPPNKRQKVTRATRKGEAIIDLTMFETGTLPVESKTAKAPIHSEIMMDREKGKEKALDDVTNDQNRHGVQLSPVPSTLVLDEDEPAMTNLVQETPINALDGYLAQVLEVIPDVQPVHARSLLSEYHPTYGTGVVAAVLHTLFEQPYPKVERNKAKRKREDTDSSDRTASKDYGSIDRPFEGGKNYEAIAYNQLTVDFPRIPVPHIRQTLVQNNGFYAPTHLMLREQLKQDPPCFILKSSPTRSSGKGKRHDPEFDRELAWLLEKLKGKATKSEDSPQGEEVEEDEECEDGIECGCCFSKYAFDKMTQCPDAHLFCRGCMRSYAANQLGQHDPNIVCMDQSGCKLSFADAELKRVLTPKLVELYERLKQAKEIEAAELDGLEECPFCEYKVVIDNPDEKLFRCEREECGAVSCRVCKKLDHLPKSCKEAEEDKGLNARHKVEEAMTEALMRNCPKCKKPFIKEGGCNKMSCPNCRTLSCYICRQVINGYDHFDSRPPGQNARQGSSSRQRCLLWDPVEQRHDREVAAAREKAIKEVEATDPEVDKKQLEVELPKTAQAANNARPGPIPLGGLGGFAVLGGIMPAVAVPEGFQLPRPRRRQPLPHLRQNPNANQNNQRQQPQAPGIANGQAQQAQQGAGPAPLVQRFGINFDFQFEPVLRNVPRLIQEHFVPPPPPPPPPAPPNPAEDVRRDIAARLEAMRRARDEWRRGAEVQERVRREWEVQQAEMRRQLRRIRELNDEMRAVEDRIVQAGPQPLAQRLVQPQMHIPAPPAAAVPAPRLPPPRPQPPHAQPPQYFMNVPGMNPVPLLGYQPHVHPHAYLQPPPRFPPFAPHPGLVRATAPTVAHVHHVAPRVQLAATQIVPLQPQAPAAPAPPPPPPPPPARDQ